MKRPLLQQLRPVRILTWSSLAWFQFMNGCIHSTNLALSVRDFYHYII